MVKMPGLPERRDFARGCVDIGELRGGVVVEEIFVVRRGQKVFIGRRGAGVAEAFLHVRALWEWRLPQGVRRVRRESEWTRSVLLSPSHSTRSAAATGSAPSATPDSNAIESDACRRGGSVLWR